MTEGKKNLSRSFGTVASLSGRRKHLMVSELDRGDKLRIITDDHWYEFDFIAPEVSAAIIYSDDPRVKNAERCAIQGALLHPQAGMIMAGRVTLGHCVIIGCKRTDSVDPDLATLPVKEVLLNEVKVFNSEDLD